MGKAQLTELSLSAYRTEVVLGEPLVLSYTAVPAADAASEAVWGKHPEALSDFLALVVETDEGVTTRALPTLEHARIYQPSEKPGQGVGFDRVDMWGLNPDHSGPWQPLFPRPGRYLLRARFEKGGRVVESEPLAIQVRAPTKIEGKALEVVKGGMVLWEPFVDRGPVDSDTQALRRLVRELAQTPYMPYALFALAERTLREAWSDAKDINIPASAYGQAVADAEKLIKEYPTFCLRDDALYTLLKSWGYPTSVRFWGINPKDPAQALPYVRQSVALAEKFLREYPQSPLRPEVETRLADDRRYLREHGP